MSQGFIENPIINSPFNEPTRHFRFTDEGITNEEVDGRRTSSYFVPIAKPKRIGTQQLPFDTEWTQNRIEENKLVNDIRRPIALWRKGGYVDAYFRGPINHTTSSSRHCGRRLTKRPRAVSTV